MVANQQQILQDVAKGKFAPVYFLCGEETYFIDVLEESIVSKAFQPGEKDFNFDVFYGKDISDVKEVVNACQVYPAFASRRVVLLREAQHLLRVEQWKSLENYLSQPTETTVLIVAHKHKTPDKRSTFYKALDKHAVVFVAEKIKEDKLPDWIFSYISNQGFQTDRATADLLAENLGNDLGRIVKEIEKLEIAVPKGSTITQQHVEQYVGISRDYNNLELVNAVQKHDVVKAIKIVRYFQSNPKAGPPPMIIATLYGFFIKLWQIYELDPATRRSDADIARVVGMSPYQVPRYKDAMRFYNHQKTEKAIALLSEYDGRSKGINNHATEDFELMTELVYKLML